MTPNEKKMGWAIVAGVMIELGVTAWNVYMALLLVPLVLTIALFGALGVTITKSLCRESRPDDARLRSTHERNARLSTAGPGSGPG